MALTQFDLAFKNAITEIRLIDARLSVIDIFLNQAKTRIENDPQVGEELFSSGFAFRDITLAVGTGNLFMPSDYYSLHRLNLSDEIETILSREGLFQISQAYEVLETYLYNQVADFIRLNNGLNLPSDLTMKTPDFEEIRKSLKRVRGRIRNRHLLLILRENIGTFRKYESCNLYNMNFAEWIDMLGGVREVTIHTRARVAVQPIGNIELFNKHFTFRNQDGHKTIFVHINDAKEVLHLLGGYIFMIYKAVTDNTFGSQTRFGTISHVFHDPYYNTLSNASES